MDSQVSPLALVYRTFPFSRRPSAKQHVLNASKFAISCGSSRIPSPRDLCQKTGKAAKTLDFHEAGNILSDIPEQIVHLSRFHV